MLFQAEKREGKIFVSQEDLVGVTVLALDARNVVNAESRAVRPDLTHEA